MTRATVIGLLLFASPAFAIDDVLLRHIDTVLDFVAVWTANCVQPYEDGFKPGAAAKLNFSEGEIAEYCACSTKLLVRQMGETDFQSLQAGKGAQRALELCGDYSVV
jgi:hypothetical protein